MTVGRRPLGRLLCSSWSGLEMYTYWKSKVRKRSSVSWFTPQARELGQARARSSELHSGLPGNGRRPSTQAFCSFPDTLTGSCVSVGQPGLELMRMYDATGCLACFAMVLALFTQAPYMQGGIIWCWFGLQLLIDSPVPSHHPLALII